MRLNLEYRGRKIIPIFVTGCQRSGTTMLASQLGNSGKSFAMPEFPILFDYMEYVYEEWDIEKLILGLKSFRFLSISLPRNVNEYIDLLRIHGFEFFCNSVIADYIEFNKIALDESEDIYWIEHSPKSRNYLSVVGSFFEDYFVIHIVRDPRSVYLSMKQLPEWPINDPATFSIMWNDAVARCISYERVFPDKVCLVKYEEYVRNSDACLRLLCERVGLKFSESMLEGGAIVLPKFTQAQHSKVNSRSSKGAGDAWLDLLSPNEIVVVEKCCSSMMAMCDYKIKFIREYSSTISTSKIFLWLLKGILYKPYSKFKYFVRNYGPDS